MREHKRGQKMKTGQILFFFCLGGILFWFVRGEEGGSQHTSWVVETWEEFREENKKLHGLLKELTKTAFLLNGYKTGICTISKSVKENDSDHWCQSSD